MLYTLFKSLFAPCTLRLASDNWNQRSVSGLGTVPEACTTVHLVGIMEKILLSERVEQNSDVVKCS